MCLPKSLSLTGAKGSDYCAKKFNVITLLGSWVYEPALIDSTELAYREFGAPTRDAPITIRGAQHRNKMTYRSQTIEESSVLEEIDVLWITAGIESDTAPLNLMVQEMLTEAANDSGAGSIHASEIRRAVAWRDETKPRRLCLHHR